MIPAPYLTVLARQALAAAVLAVAACQQAATPPPPTPPTPSATPAPALRQPLEAVLADADVGRPRTAGRDHLTYAEAARDQPDEVLALRLYSGWGWVDMATREWGSPADQVLLTLRPEGATRAYQLWAAGLERAPYAPAACPTSIAGLDQCRMATSGGSAIVVGRLDAEVFQLRADAGSIERLAGLQAGRLRAP